MNWNGDRMTHDHEEQTERYSQATWDARYGGSTQVWSGNPNPRLVEHVTGLTPGTALDVGAGEGADAVWLAGQGWQVTALDVSPVALSRVAEHAAAAGVSERVTLLRHDLITGTPLPGSYDLVSAQFWHPPVDRHGDFDSVIGEAVRPGGILLVVGHHAADLPAGTPDPHGHAGLLYTPEQIAAVLPAARWDVRLVGSPTRPSTRPDGPHILTDAVVLAVRR
jgi:SAM-dependent methyltransferase